MTLTRYDVTLNGIYGLLLSTKFVAYRKCLKGIGNLGNKIIYIKFVWSKVIIKIFGLKQESFQDSVLQRWQRKIHKMLFEIEKKKKQQQQQQQQQQQKNNREQIFIENSGMRHRYTKSLDQS